ncbi:MAG TPA: hypothetical protein VFS00_24985, partial [Polyangiaceae bacterium]|nr:hypothetical protein [Polyangiaceae bacterium]
VVKVGSSSLTSLSGGLDPARLDALVDALAARTPPPRAYELDPPPPDDWRKPAGAIGLAVGTTLVAMGVAATLRISKVNKEFRSSNEFLKYESGLPAGVGMCDAADQGIASSAPDAASPTLVRTRCHTRSDWQVVQPLGFIGGGLLIAGGAALLVSSAVAPRRAEEARAGKLRLSFAPTWSPRSAGATIGGTW